MEKLLPEWLDEIEKALDGPVKPIIPDNNFKNKLEQNLLKDQKGNQKTSLRWFGAVAASFAFLVFLNVGIIWNSNYSSSKNVAKGEEIEEIMDEYNLVPIYLDSNFS